MTTMTDKQDLPPLPGLGPSPEHFEIMRSALDHIAKTAHKSRTSTRRLRWIAARAELAIRGEPYSDDLIDLPKSAGPETQERMKLQIRALTEELEAIRSHEAERGARGWKLVPADPTLDMGWAYLDAARADDPRGAEELRFSWPGYRAMLAAAPTPETGPQKWIDFPDSSGQGLMLNPEWLKLHNDTQAVEASNLVQAEAPRLTVGGLPTVNRDEYPALDAWWVQIWDGDAVFARVYGPTPEAAQERARQLVASVATPPTASPVGEPLTDEAIDKIAQKHLIFIHHTIDDAHGRRLRFAREVIRAALATQPTASNAGEQMAVGSGLNPHYAGNFDEETAELADLRRSLAKEIDRLRAALAQVPEQVAWVAVVEEQLGDNCARVRWMFNPVPEGQELLWDHQGLLAARTSGEAAK